MKQTPCCSNAKAGVSYVGASAFEDAELDGHLDGTTGNRRNLAPKG